MKVTRVIGGIFGVIMVLGVGSAEAYESSPYTSSPIISNAAPDGTCRRGAQCQFGGACVPLGGKCYNCIEGLNYQASIGCYSCVQGTSLKNKNGKLVCSD